MQQVRQTDDSGLNAWRYSPELLGHMVNDPLRSLEAVTLGHDIWLTGEHAINCKDRIFSTINDLPTQGDPYRG